jgi:DnaJ family protein C protein 2
VEINSCRSFGKQHMAVSDLASTKKEETSQAAAAGKTLNTQETAKPKWTPKEVATLIKAVKLFPGGTLDRWFKIAEYVNEHGGEEGETGTRQRSAKECIATSKTVQQAASADRAKLQASVQKPVAKVDVKDPPTVRLTDSKMGDQAPGAKENAAPSTGKNAAAGSPSTLMAPLNASWNADQQLALENGLRTFPAAAFRASPNDRWAKIAETIPGKSVKEVKARVKELAELAKTKKK